MGYKEVQEKSREIHRAVAESGVLIGEKTDSSGVPGVGVPAGLGMDTYANNLAAEAERLEKSNSFKILFMGMFKNGKSTTINALMAGDLLPVGVTATTAVISQVVYGQDTEHVKIYRENTDVPQVLSVPRFLSEFVLTDEDIVKIEEEGGSDRFKDVDYVVLESGLDIFRDGVQFIDSPGLGEAVARTKTTNKFIPQANAVVFLLDATHLLGDKEKEYIRKHFVYADPKPRNVFFLINRMNFMRTEAERDSIRKQTELMLRGVFTGENGFDQELFQSRVFFVDSYGALEMYKRGEEAAGTGIPEFKAALESFLTSEDRVISRYQSVVGNMAGVYLEAARQVEENSALMVRSADELEANRAAASAKLEELEKDVARMEQRVDLARDTITDKVLQNLELFVKIDLRSDWAAYASEYDEKFGIGDMLKLALPVSDVRKQEILAPMVRYVNEYVENKLERWSESVPLLVSEDIAALQEDLEDSSIRFDLKLEQAKAIFAGADPSKWRGEGANKLQLALSLIQGDVSVAVDNSVGGNFTWGEFFKKYLGQALINILISSLIGGGVPGLLALAAVEMLQMGIHKNSTRERLLNGFAESLFPKISEKLMDKSQEISADLAKQFDQQKQAVTGSGYSLIEEEKRRELDIIDQAKRQKDEIAREEDRQKQILGALFDRIALVYRILYNKTLDMQDMEKVAALVGKAENR